MPYRPKGTRVSLRIAPDLEARLTRSPRVAAEMTKVVREIATRADAAVPVRTGTLRDSQLTEVRITPEGVVGLIAYTAYWAHFVHNGTVNQPANPWLLNSALSVLVKQRAA